jgi:hypothetical protein
MTQNWNRQSIAAAEVLRPSLFWVENVDVKCPPGAREVKSVKSARALNEH